MKKQELIQELAKMLRTLSIDESDIDIIQDRLEFIRDDVKDAIYGCEECGASSLDTKGRCGYICRGKIAELLSNNYIGQSH